MRSAWYLILPLFLGCAGKNTVAGEDKTKAQRLATSVPSWCQSTCEKIADCEAAAGDECTCSGDACDCDKTTLSGCVSNCSQAFERFTQGSDACADVGERFKSCIDVLKCSQITSGSGNDCNPSAQDEALCPEPDDSSGDGAPPVSGIGGATSVGGTANSGDDDGASAGTSAGGATGGTTSSGVAGTATGGTGIAGHGGTSTTGGTGSTVAVSCEDSYGTGGSAGTAATSAVTCEEGRMGCSDGHEYAWLCARSSDDKIGCACFVDGAATGGFDPQSATCPTLARVNSGCSFGLTN